MISFQTYSWSAGIVQLQLEQDSGKSLHDQAEEKSLIDLNRFSIICCICFFQFGVNLSLIHTLQLMHHTTLICFKYKVRSKMIIQVYLNGDSALKIP